MPQFLQRFSNIPTPIAGLALGIGSLGWCWENTGPFSGQAQILGAAFAGGLLILLAVKFVLFPRLLVADLAHPVVGSVVPTFAMATMVVSKAIGGLPADALWLFAVMLHLAFLFTFTVKRLKAFELHHMVPSWFVPPVGIVVAVLTNPSSEFVTLSQGLLWFGLVTYGLLLPVMLYRLIFGAEIPDGAKPTIAILAAPASLSLAGYLDFTSDPSALLVALLLGIALLMTTVIYLAFARLMRLPFSPAYAAFTFPMVIGATALFKAQGLFIKWGVAPDTIAQLQWLARLELVIATLVVGYVALRFLAFYTLPKAHSVRKVA